jgi:hypothetical protein
LGEVELHHIECDLLLLRALAGSMRGPCFRSARDVDGQAIDLDVLALIVDRRVAL